MIQTFHEVRNQLKNLLPTLRRDFHVERIGVFGSVARHEERPDSDVDVLVSFSESPGFFKFVRLENYLAGALKRRVDLVTRRALKPAMKKEILRHVSYV
jgi:predicted nucleotidyltransferase